MESSPNIEKRSNPPTAVNITAVKKQKTDAYVASTYTQVPLPLQQGPTLSIYDAALEDICWDTCDRALGYGTAGTVYEVPNTPLVIKAAHPEEPELWQNERQIYIRLATHPAHARIVRCWELKDDVAFLERLQKTLKERLQAQTAPPSLSLRIRWAIEASEGLSYLHSLNILQADVSTNNMMLDHFENLKIIDFSGSTIDGVHGGVYYGSRNKSPHRHHEDDDITIATEIFAFGSVLYELECGREPYAELQRHEVDRKYKVFDFADVCGFVLEGVIRRCWNEGNGTVEDVRKDLVHVKNCVDRCEEIGKPKHIGRLLWCRGKLEACEDPIRAC